MRRLMASPAGWTAALMLASLAMPDCRSEARAPHEDILATGTKLYSLRNEELIIRDFFQDRRDGFFLDVGCAWPIKENNTYYLEKHLGWSGIAVDGLPEYAALWRKRPKSRFFNYLVTDHDDSVEPFYRAELPDISAARPMKGPAGGPVKYEEIRVPTITLNRLLERNGVSEIDLLSMDIENFEVIALAGFDIARFRPKLACIEAKGANRAQIMEYFAAHGYRRIDRYLEHDPVNYYFTPAAGGPGLP